MDAEEHEQLRLWQVAVAVVVVMAVVMAAAEETEAKQQADDKCTHKQEQGRDAAAKRSHSRYDGARRR